MENAFVDIKEKSYKWFISTSGYRQSGRFYGYYNGTHVVWKGVNFSNKNWTYLEKSWEDFSRSYPVQYVTLKSLILRGWI